MDFTIDKNTDKHAVINYNGTKGLIVRDPCCSSLASDVPTPT